MPRKILKHEYKPQGIDLCNLGKCWDERRTQDIKKRLSDYNPLFSSIIYVYDLVDIP